MSIIEIRAISKRFRKRVLFKDASFTFAAGRTYGLIGANGSGKSVLLKMICGFMLPDTGKVLVDEKYRPRGRAFPDSFGVSIDGPAYLPNETGMSNLLELAAIRKSIDERSIRSTMQHLGLDPELKQKVRHYSLGMKQKLSLAQALMEDPDVLLLDEPFNALDTEGCKMLSEVLQLQKSAGKTIIFTSHRQEDVDSLSDEVVRISEGQLLKVA